MTKWLIRLVGFTPFEGRAAETTDRPDPQFETEWRPLMKRRVLVVLGLLGFWGVSVEARLVWLQVVQHERLAAEAQKQQADMVYPDAGRGDILDRNGVPLAASVEAFDISVDPSLSKDPVQEARLICEALGDCRPADLRDLTAKLSKKGDKWEPVRQAGTVSPEAAARVAALKGAPHQLASIVPLIAQSKRFYPKRELAAHLLGFVGDANKGAGGIEAKFDTEIRGRQGRVLVLKAGPQRELSTRVEVAPTAGATFELTIDATLQYHAERVLHEGVQSSQALGGTLIAMNPRTGELLAFANDPPFNPNSYRDYPVERLRNRGVQDIYEPGSTFKIITAAAALEEGVLAPTDLIDTNPGSIRFGARVIDEDKGHNYGVLTFEDVLIKSSNVGAVRAGLKIGAERLARYAQRFGIGQRLSPDFAGESAGQFYPAALDDSGLASVAMGYQVGVTPLQMVTACSVIANGGQLVEPHLVRAVIRDGVREVRAPKILRQVVHEQTAWTLRTIMEGVTARGTATRAALERYQVAGKTGTATKAIPGGYSKTDYNVSFVGFVPSRDPAFVVLVVIDTPRGVPAYGGTVAAPVFRAFAEAALQHAGVPPSIHPLPAIIAASGPRPAPLPAAPVTVVPTSVRTGERPVMPDLRGLSLREALRIANALGVSMMPEGEGVVVSQRPAPGEIVDPSTVGSLQLRRVPASAIGGGR